MFTRSLWESEGVPSLPNTDPQFADTIPPRDHLRNVEARPSTLRQMSLRLTVTALDTAERFEARALLDSGCTTSSIDRDFVKRKQLTTQPAAVVRAVYNADGSVNGFIKEYVELLVVVRDALPPSLTASDSPPAALYNISSL